MSHAMLNVREKMVELLLQEDDLCERGECKDCFANGSCYYYRAADRLIANGISAQEWITVEDRLPEESGMYIVTANDGHAQRVSFVLWQKKNRMWNLTGARSYWRVTHWQPMPQPPKREERNE